MPECKNVFANRLRRYLMRDPFDYNFPVGEVQRVFKLAEACDVFVSDVCEWGLGWNEPSPWQRAIILDAVQDVPGALL